ncbi:hypothetical protein ALC57_09216 [Trachymyrmex cornetzi]|uniref:Uncharacterized protein n=1 Tax=Trachymyrmex cornetzi TaxID=471704 RepID=A0A195E0B3_9HYME|nr:hypothetical protein ALC57_09216 [Trachymyrmex cornetzi]
MEDQIHSELILKEEREEDEIKGGRCSAETAESEKSVTPDGSAIGIRPKPLIYKPENVSIGCKSEPLETKWHWAPGAWQDSTRTSAFQPYKKVPCGSFKSIIHFLSICDGNTPLIYGAHCDHPHVCYELLIKGAEITLTNTSNVSAYKAAIMNNSMNAKAVIENHLIPQIISTPTDEL